MPEGTIATITPPGKKLTWESVGEVRRSYDREIRKGPANVVLDFAGLTTIFADGVVPIVAWVDAMRRRKSGPEMLVRPPADARLRRTATALGWLHALAPSRYRRGSDTDRRLSLHSFESERQLNQLLDRMFRICRREVDFAPGALDAFEWAVNEMAGNVLDHAEEQGWIQFTTFSRRREVALVVCDAGVSIPTTMKRRFRSIQQDSEALQMAVQEGVTSDPEKGRGIGLFGCKEIARTSGGSFLLASGSGQLRGAGPAFKLATDRLAPAYAGTFVELRLPTNRPVDRSSLLGGQVVPTTEVLVRPTGEIAIRLREHARAFGNRPTGERIRRVIRNLLIAQPTDRILVDLAGIRVVSSSFADEVFGKLAAEMGVLDFGQRVQLTGANALCRQLIEGAIQGRIRAGSKPAGGSR